ncbi:MAG: 2-phosphosulfolactate phosphatase, partial [Gammaproteobacteria bacterium]
MQIHSADFVAGAAAARGVAIVIDVFRACSLQAHALARGAHCVVPVEDIEEARALKQAHPEWLLAG